MYCNKCGQPLSVESSFCNKCGNDLRNLVGGTVAKSIVDSGEKKTKRNNWLINLLNRLSENIKSNVLVCIGSIIAIIFSISNIRDVYDDIILKLKLIKLQKEIVDLSHQIYGSALSDEDKLSNYNFELYLDIGKVLLLGGVIIISMLLLIYFLKKLITLSKFRYRVAKGDE